MYVLGVVLPPTPRYSVFRQVGQVTVVGEHYLHILFVCLIVPFPTMFFLMPIVIANKTLRSSFVHCVLEGWSFSRVVERFGHRLPLVWRCSCIACLECHCMTKSSRARSVLLPQFFVQ